MTEHAAVRLLRQEEVGPAVAMLARAFADDPVATLMDADPARREASLRWLHRLFVRYGLAYGEVWTTDALDGAAIWWAPPYVLPESQRLIPLGLANGPAVLGTDAMTRLMGLGASSGDLHQRVSPDPHWYLSILGVEPARQRQGVGSRLLASMLARLDRERLPAYLETMTSENVPYYQRHGFAVAGEARLGDGGITIWGMLRRPA